jgi:uncharacterized protein (TIGR03086 family)
MTSDLRLPHRAALALVAGLVTHVEERQRGWATPCAGWDLADLLAHMVGQHRGFARAVRDGYADVEAHAPVPFTPAVWDESVTDLLEAFAEADLAATAVERELSTSPLPVGHIVSAQLLDTVVHGWDIAQALHLDFQPPPELLEPVATVAASIPAAASTPGGPFAPPLPATGTVWQRILARVGRDAHTGPHH